MQPVGVKVTIRGRGELLLLIVKALRYTRRGFNKATLVLLAESIPQTP